MMVKQPRGAFRFFAMFGALIFLASAALPRLSANPAPGDEPALGRARAQARMLDDLFKVAVVDITNRYDGPPAAKVAKTIFAAAKDKKYFDAKLLDATGSPLNEANVAGDAFEKRAARAMREGKTYLEEV